MDDKQTDLILIGNEISEHTALHILLTTTEINNHNLTIKIPFVSYRHSLKLIDSIEQILEYMAQNCRLLASEDSKRNNVIIWLFNYLTRSTMNIDLSTLMVIFPKDIALQFDHIRIRNSSQSIIRL